MLRTACDPASNTNDRMQRIPGIHTARQIAIRTIQGSATTASTTMQTIASHVNQSAAAKREGFKSIREQYATQGGVSGIGWDIACQQIARDIGVGQFEKLDESRAFVACRLGVALSQVTQQQEVEFLHAASASPLQFPHHFQGLTPHDGIRRRSGAVHGV
jgi:hypothetical protein